MGKKKRWVEYEAVEYRGRISTGFRPVLRRTGTGREGIKEDDIL